jgi:hypothetical protein
MNRSRLLPAVVIPSSPNSDRDERSFYVSAGRSRLTLPTLALSTGNDLNSVAIFEDL